MNGQAGSAHLFQCPSAFEIGEKRIISALAQHVDKPVVVVAGQEVKVGTDRTLSEEEFRIFLAASGLDHCRHRSVTIPPEGPGATTVTESFIGTGSDRRAIVITER